FFVYTLLGGLLMLVGIIGLAYLHHKATGTTTFDYQALRDLSKNQTTQRWLFLAFFAAFAVKTPLVPFHTWLPDAYTEAPPTTTVQGSQGGVFYMVAHGLTIGGLFFVAGMLEERRGTTRIDEFGGLQRSVPHMGGVMLVITLAAVALPGLVGFVGEFLTLLGAF